MNKDQTDKLVVAQIKLTNSVFEKAGIKEVLISPTSELDYDARPVLYVSYKQFDRIMKNQEGK